MPKVVHVAGATPVNVELASRAFGTTARIHVIRYFRLNPGRSQVEAAAALGVHPNTVARLAKELVGMGILTETPSQTDRRELSYSVDVDHLAKLLAALTEFALTDDE